AHCLFHSLQEIAAEKAGIINPGVPVIVAEQRDEARPVILAKAHDLSAPIIETNSAFCIESAQMMNGFVRAEIQEIATHKHFEVAPHLAGRFQLQNALNAVTTARILQSKAFRVSDDDIEKGISAAVWPGRIEKVHTSPDIYLDGAHNPSAARELAIFLEENLTGRKLILVSAPCATKPSMKLPAFCFHSPRKSFSLSRILLALFPLRSSRQLPATMLRNSKLFRTLHRRCTPHWLTPLRWM